MRSREHDAELAMSDNARLEALLIEGLTSGEDTPMKPEFWRELKADAAKILAKRKAMKW